jgi:hypothetical protein
VDVAICIQSIQVIGDNVAGQNVKEGGGHLYSPNTNPLGEAFIREDLPSTGGVVMVPYPPGLGLGPSVHSAAYGRVYGQ